MFHDFFFRVMIDDRSGYNTSRKEWEKHLIERIKGACHSSMTQSEVTPLQVEYINDDKGNKS